MPALLKSSAIAQVRPSWALGTNWVFCCGRLSSIRDQDFSWYDAYKCPPWAWRQIFHPQATLGQMHLRFPHPSCLPGHGSPCSSEDQPHRLSRVCAREGSFCKNWHRQMQSQSVIFIVASVQAPDHISWRAESRLRKDLLLFHIALQPSKGVSVPCVTPQDLCVQYMAWTNHTHGISPTA